MIKFSLRGGFLRPLLIVRPPLQSSLNPTPEGRTIRGVRLYDGPLCDTRYAHRVPLDARVPADVVVAAVAAALPVGAVVLRVVRHQVAQSEPVVRGHKVDAARKQASRRKSARGLNPRGSRRDLSVKSRRP
eukprot:1176256-Prorocentrum_minimum.AAC.1